MTSAVAELTNTIVGGWDIQHPTYGYRHVLAYQNAPINLAAGANCMFLHISTAKPLIPNQLVDTSKSPSNFRFDFFDLGFLGFFANFFCLLSFRVQNHIT